MFRVSRWFRSYGYAEVLDDLVIGAYPTDRIDVSMLSNLGIERVLNLVEDQEYRPGERQAVATALSAAAIQEQRLNFVDYGGLPPDQIEAAVEQVQRWLGEGRRVYVHCRAGWQRSASVAAGVLAVREGIDIDQALERIKRRKPSADPLPNQREDLRHWLAARSDGAGA